MLCKSNLLYKQKYIFKFIKYAIKYLKQIEDVEYLNSDYSYNSHIPIYILESLKQL